MSHTVQGDTSLNRGHSSEQNEYSLHQPHIPLTTILVTFAKKKISLCHSDLTEFTRGSA